MQLVSLKSYLGRRLLPKKRGFTFVYFCTSKTLNFLVCFDETSIALKFQRLLESSITVVPKGTITITPSP